MLNKKLKKEWVKALRSGDYEQGKWNLCQEFPSDEGPKFCCLGVLCDIAFEGDWILNSEFRWEFHYKNTFACNLLKQGWVDEIGLDVHQHTVLSVKNDHGESFEQIANYIENSEDI